MYEFNKTRRLLTKQDFDSVFKCAKKVVSAEFVVLFSPNQKKHARLGVVLSKKVIKKAHDRNAVKRALRESFRIHLKIPAVDIVVLVKPAIQNIPVRQMSFKLGRLWDALCAQHAP